MPSRRRILSQHGRHDEAAAEIDVALRLDPESYEVNRAAAYLRFSQQRLDEAVRYYEKSMTLMETDLNSGVHVAHLLHRGRGIPRQLRGSRKSHSRVPKRLWRRIRTTGRPWPMVP